MPPKKKIKEDPDVIVLDSSSDEENKYSNKASADSKLSLNVKRDVNIQPLAKNIINQIGSTGSASNIQTAARVQDTIKTNNQPSKFLRYFNVIFKMGISVFRTFLKKSSEKNFTKHKSFKTIRVT
jgi:hypothetical protein